MKSIILGLHVSEKTLNFAAQKKDVSKLKIMSLSGEPQGSILEGRYLS